MRLGIDVQTLETAERERGIGRYTSGLIEALHRWQQEVRVILFGFSEESPLPSLEYVSYVKYEQAGDKDALLQKGVAAPLAWQPKTEGLDAFLVTSPLMPDILIPRHAPCPLGCILYDLIPLVLRHRIPDILPTSLRPSYDRRLEIIKNYRFAAAISEATKSDAITWLDWPSAHIASISTGIDQRFFQSVEDGRVQSTLSRLDISTPFIFSLSGYNPRKNWEGTLEAYAGLPHELRQTYSLVLSCSLTDDQRRHILQKAQSLGIDSRLRLTGFVSEDDLPPLYHAAACFVFTSRCEGFGIPLAEAMACGCPVIAADNSSLPEVVGDCGRLASAEQPQSFSRAIEETLRDRARTTEMADKARTRAENFKWECVAERFLQFLHREIFPEIRISSETEALRAIVRPPMPGSSFEADCLDRCLTTISEKMNLPLIENPATAESPIYPLAGGVDVEFFYHWHNRKPGAVWILEDAIAVDLERHGPFEDSCEESESVADPSAETPPNLHPLMLKMVRQASEILASPLLCQYIKSRGMQAKPINPFTDLLADSAWKWNPKIHNILVVGDVNRSVPCDEALRGLDLFLSEDQNATARFLAQSSSPPALKALYRTRSGCNNYERIEIDGLTTVVDLLESLLSPTLCIYLPHPGRRFPIFQQIAMTCGCPLAMYGRHICDECPTDAVFRLIPEKSLSDQIFYLLREIRRQPDLLKEVSRNASTK